MINLQESHLDDNSFENCPFITGNFMIIPNNSPSKFGTASLVRNSLSVDIVSFDANCRIILFDIENVTFGNVYLVQILHLALPGKPIVAKFFQIYS